MRSRLTATSAPAQVRRSTIVGDLVGASEPRACPGAVASSRAHACSSSESAGTPAARARAPAAPASVSRSSAMPRRRRSPASARTSPRCASGTAPAGRRVRPELRDDGALRDDPSLKRRVLRRVDAPEPGADDRDRAAAVRERGAVRCRVDPRRQARDDRVAAVDKVLRDRACRGAVPGGSPCARRRPRSSARRPAAAGPRRRSAAGGRGPCAGSPGSPDRAP